MEKSSPDIIKANEEELAEWEAEVDRLQKLRPVQVTRDRLKTVEVPTLEREIAEQESAVEAATSEADRVSPPISYDTPINAIVRRWTSWML